MSVIWSGRALGELDRVGQATPHRSAASARRLVARIISRCELLDGMTHLGAAVEEYDDEDLRELIESPYRIIYRVVGADVEIIRVIHVNARLPRRP